MKQQMSPVVAAVIVVVFLAAVGAYMWKSLNSGGITKAEATKGINLDGMEKDPQKFQQQLSDEYKKQQASKK